MTTMLTIERGLVYTTDWWIREVCARRVPAPTFDALHRAQLGASGRPLDRYSENR
jgi:hypothetical protein